MARRLVSDYAVFENVGGSRDIVFYYDGGGADSVTGVGPEEAAYIAGLLREERPVSYDHDRRRLSTYTPEPTGERERPPDLNAWLGAHRALAAEIVWQDATSAQAWPSWSAARKEELRSAFLAAWSRSSVPVPSVPANVAAPADDEHATTVLSSADAWALFKAGVAQSLAIELGQHVSWSLLQYPPEQLRQLLDSRELFLWSPAPEGYRIDNMHGHLVPAPPLWTYQFLGLNDLIGHSRLETVSRILNWCRDNLVHFSGGTTAANMEDQWQYRGYPPLSRVIAGTVQASQPQFGVRHRTAGCWGTSGFLRAVLRAVNVPVRLVSNAGHAQPWFMSEGRYLSHGDDPYNALSRSTPAFPAGELLIDQSKFGDWFGPSVPAAAKQDNIGRRTRELALVHLPNYLLHAHCSDLGAGHSHADSEVFEIFSRNYTLDELEEARLWQRMEAKIASLGGCAHVP